MWTKNILICILLFVQIIFSKIYAQKNDKPNIVLIVVDDLNDYTGFLGGHPQVKTPNMDALAKAGTVFTNAHTNSPICAPSRASFLTGIYPHISKNFWFSKWSENKILKNCKSLPQYMRDNGYNAYATGKLMHHKVKSEWTEYGIENDFGPYAFNGKKIAKHPSMPEAYSNDKNDGLFTSLADVPKVKSSGKFPGYKGWFDARNGKPFKYVSDDDRDLMNDEKSANWAIKKIENLEENTSQMPFFMAIGFVRPHTPLVAPQKYFDMYPLESLKIPVIKKDDDDDTFYKTTFGWIPPWAKHYEELENSFEDVNDGLRRYTQAYLACVSFVDEQVGQVLKAINKSKFKENTVIILVSDHGYNHGQKKFLYKNNPWEESTRIPMLIKAPNLKQSHGKRIHHPVSLIDIFPTIADFANITSTNLKNKNGKPLSGFSLKPFLKNPKKPNWDGPKVALTAVVSNKFKSTIPSDHSYAVRSKKFRYILYANGKEELYNHKKDPYEWTNLASNKKYRKIKKELKLQMQELLNRNK